MERPIDEVKALLGEPLNTDDGHALANQLSEIEAWGAYVSYEYRAAARDLAEKRNQYYPQSGTVDAKAVELAGRLAMEQEKVDGLKDISEIIVRRISLGQTLLKSMRVEAEHGLR